MARPRNKTLPEETITLLPSEKELGETSGNDSLSLNFVEADDTGEEAPKPSKLKSIFTKVFTTTEEEEKQEKRGRKKQSRFFVKHVYLVIGLFSFLINLLTPDEYKEVITVNEKDYSLLPSNEHLENILTPLARIADRHTNIADLNPDVTDALTSLNCCVAYGMEARSVLMLKRHIERQKEQEEKQQYKQPLSYEGFISKHGEKFNA